MRYLSHPGGAESTCLTPASMISGLIHTMYITTSTTPDHPLPGSRLSFDLGTSVAADRRAFKHLVLAPHASPARFRSDGAEGRWK